MELFLPSLIVLVLAAIVCFYMIPKMSAYTLGMISIIMFALGIWQHYKMFPYEYTTLGGTELIKNYSGFLMVAAVIIGGIILTLQFFGANPPSTESILPASIIPNMGFTNTKSIFNLSGNNSKSIFNLGGNTGSNPLTAVTNMFKNSGIASTSFKTV